MKIYTDGSFNKKLSMNSTAFSAVIVKEETTKDYLVDIIYGVITEPIYTKMWNVGGEIWGVIFGIDYAIQSYNPNSIEIYYDYIGLGKWVSGEWKTKNEATASYARYIERIRNERSVVFHKVTGHSNNLLNDVADYYANCGTKKYLEAGEMANNITDLRISKS